MSNHRDIRFSVVIPAYNAAKTIARAIDSCLQQSYAPFEIIVVNDAGTDETEAIINSYGTQLRQIKMLQNSGGAIARNKGLEAATGDYIAFLDADDIWHPQKLEMMSTILEGVQGISLLYHSFTLSDINTVAIPENATLYRLPFVKLLQRNPIATPCAIIRNDKSFRFEASMRYMEDYDLWLRIAYKHKAFFIDLPLTQLGRPVRSAGGVSAGKWQMRKGELKAYTRLIKLNPLYTLALPFLYSYSLGKHLFKAISDK